MLLQWQGLDCHSATWRRYTVLRSSGSRDGTYCLQQHSRIQGSSGREGGGPFLGMVCMAPSSKVELQQEWGHYLGGPQAMLLLICLYVYEGTHVTEWRLGQFWEVSFLHHVYSWYGTHVVRFVASTFNHRAILQVQFLGFFLWQNKKYVILWWNC